MSPKGLFVFIIVSCGFFQKAGAAEVCKNSGQMGVPFENSEMWIDLTKQASLAAAEGDFKGFCEWNRMDRGSSALAKSGGPEGKNKILEKYRYEKLDGNRDEAADALLSTSLNGLVDPWEASMLGHPALKERANRGSAFTRACMVKRTCQTSLLKALELPDLRGHYDVPEYKSKGPIAASQKEILGACAFLSPLATLPCSGASNQLLKWVEIHENKKSEQITNVPLLKETLADPKITSALKRTAIKLFKNLEAKGLGPQSSIFTDLTEELKKDGFSEEASRKQAVKILGAIASGGPNLVSRIETEEVSNFPNSCLDRKSCNLNGIFMQAIAEGIVRADTQMMQAGHPSVYSLPAGAGFPCDSGKAYHFWATAAWTDRLMDEGYSAKAARAAVYASHLGYHLRGDNKKRTNSVLSMPRYGAVENGIRIDLTMASAGSSFGTQLNQKSAGSDLKMKEGFLTVMREGSNTPANPNTDFERSEWQVLDWTQRTGVKAAFGLYGP